MISRLTREAAGGVLSFTFLDVLTCTMGSLVLLVVVLGEKAANTRLEDALRNPGKGGSTTVAGASSTGTVSTPKPKGENGTPSGTTETADAAALQREKAKLEKLAETARRRLAEEQARLAHLEEHERRLEHELAKLHASFELLQASEQQQTVDQATAERELERLKQLIEDFETQLQSLTMAGGKKSYAIVPYKGKHGTFRRPIYIECTKGELVVQPEGVRLNASALGEFKAGMNPLTAAVRAVNEELNKRARAAGEPEMPDAYPLLVVRPDGVEAYYHAVRALDTWNSEYGEEFVEANWDLHYPEPDYQLERIMTHAISQAVIRQEQLARMAPRAYGGRKTSDRSQVIRQGPQHGVGGPDGSERATGDNWLANPVAREGGEVATSDRSRREYGETRRPSKNQGNFADEFLPPGEVAAAAAGPGEDVPGGVPGGPLASGVTTPTSPNGPAQQSMPDAASSEGGGGQYSASSTPTNTNSQSISATSSTQAASAAKSRGSNWANKAASRGAPITRPIHVVVQPEHLSVAPTAGTAPGESILVTFHQPQDQVLNELASAIRNHIEDWGFAGRGMYWRPTLVLQVNPDSMRQAERLQELLADSGVDIRLDQLAELPAVEPIDARK